MPNYQRLTDRTLAPSISLDDILHIVITGDTSQNPAGSSYKATLSQVASLIGGCSTENTLIASNSGYFTPSTSFKTSSLYIGNGKGCGWNGCPWDYPLSFKGGTAPPIPESISNVGVPSPVDIRSGDTIHLCGNIYFNINSSEIQPSFVISLFLYQCHDLSVTRRIPLTSVITPTRYEFDKNTLCFDLSHTFTQYYDSCDVFFVVGMSVTHNSELTGPANFTYTLNYEKNCSIPDGEFYLLRNCCEPTVTEIINGSNLTIGSFWSDSDGNCWEIESTGTTAPNSARSLVNDYESCESCVSSNPCPDNVNIISCCVEGLEYVSGSLDLTVGDYFVDDYGFCWSIDSNTSAPVTAPTITIGTTGYTSCDDCINNNDCPSVWVVESCCDIFSQEVIHTTLDLSIDEVWVDSDGICWTIISEANELPTNYEITLTTPSTDCVDCVDSNTCPDFVYVTLRHCCDLLQVEVAIMEQVPTTGTIFSDVNGVCWEVVGWSLVGTPTWPVMVIPEGQYDSCDSCQMDIGICPDYYLFESCCENGITEIAFGTYVIGRRYTDLVGNCYTCVSITTDPPTTNFSVWNSQYDNCNGCIGQNVCNYVEITDCCGVQSNQIVLVPSNGLPTNFYDSDSGTCWEFVNNSAGPSTLFLGTITEYIDCPECTAVHNCS
jgi:hypothetical protein